MAWKLFKDGKQIHLEPTVLRLLIYLISNRDRLVTHHELMDTVWGDTVISESALSKAVARLRKALGDNPASPRYIETVHSQGYRFAAEVEMPGQEAPVVRPPHETRILTRRNTTIAGIVAIALILVGFLYWPGQVEQGVQHSDQIRSIAVLPLKNLTGNPKQDYVTLGLHDTLTTELSRISELRVTSSQSTLHFRGSDLTAPEIASELGVDVLVEGSLLEIGERIAVNLQLIDGKTDAHIWARHFERDTPYIFNLLTDAANTIASEIGLPSDHEMIGAIAPSAIQAYWLGLDFMNQVSPVGLSRAIGQFHTATEIEPRFDLAWSNLAFAHFLQALAGFAPPHESMEQARLAAQQAIQVGNRPSLGLAALGLIRAWDQDIPGGCEAFRDALRINPSAPLAIHGDADCLLYEDREEESLERIRELSLIAPFSFMHQLPLSYHLFLARHYEEALAVTLNIQERFPHSPVHVNLSLIYWQQGQYDKALEEERRKYELYGDTEILELFDQDMATTTPQEFMRVIAEKLAERSGESYVDAFEIAEAYTRGGAVDEAIYWLTRAVEQKSFEAVHLPFRPDFDGLRDDPRFSQLLQRLGYPTSEP
ncbi:MAG: winged helix-turn-helix domain-containing protein [Xanthomonadales bacterium]|nr:winged helix-turn-helix domain-containing protein [Xanthomonadales bacterium]